MPTITLTNGKQCLVDEEDFQFLSQWSWKQHRARYAYRTIRRNGRSGGWKNLYMHHLLLPATDGLEVDHINRDRLDNRRSNLRLVPHWRNEHNRETRTNTRGSRGVSRPRGRTRWQAQIYINCKRIWLGTFASQAEAEEAYRQAQVRYGVN